MNEELRMWVFGEGLKDATDGKPKRVLPDSEQQDEYNKGYEEGEECLSHAYCSCCGRPL